MNELEPESAGMPPLDGASEAENPRPSLLRSAWRGAKTGFRLTSYVVGPIAGMAVLFGTAQTAFGLGAGRVWGELEIAFREFVLYLVLAALGAICGAGFGLVGALVGRVVPERFRVSPESALHRPIRRFRRRPDPAATVEAASSRPRKWRWLRLIGIRALVVLAIALGAGLYFKQAVDRRLAEATTAADREDPYWRLDDLMAHREAVPDEENSALVLAEALELLPENWPNGPKSPPETPNPQPTAEAKAFDRLETAADNIRLDDATTAPFRKELETYDEAVQIARTVANYRRGRHELEMRPNLHDIPLPETQAARTAARFLAVERGDPGPRRRPRWRLDSCRAILGTGRSIGDEPFAISHFMRVVIGSIAMNAIQRALGQGEPSDAALARLQALILDELDQPHLLNALRGERALLVELIRRLGTGELSISKLAEGGAPSDPNAPRGTIAPWSKLWFDYQQGVALEWLNDAVAIAPPAHRRAARPLGCLACQHGAGRAEPVRKVRRNNPAQHDTGPALLQHRPFPIPGRAGRDGHLAGRRAPSSQYGPLAGIDRRHRPEPPAESAARPVLGTTLPHGAPRRPARHLLDRPEPEG